MGQYVLRITESARRQLTQISAVAAKRIVLKLEFFVVQSNPLQWAKPLRDSRYGQYRFRIGDYRALFDVSPQGAITILMILAIKHRKDIYRDI